MARPLFCTDLVSGYHVRRLYLLDLLVTFAGFDTVVFQTLLRSF